MKIELKMNNDTLMAIAKMLQGVYTMPVSMDRREKVYRSISYDLADKFDAKYRTKIKKSDLFDQKKLTKFSLKFHEAFALQQILMDLIQEVDNDLNRTLAQKVINALDQKTV